MIEMACCPAIARPQMTTGKRFREAANLPWLSRLTYNPGMAIASARRRRVLIRTTEPLQRPQHRRASAAEFADCYCVNPVRSRLESFSMRLSFSITSFGSRPRFTRLMSAGTEAERSASSLASC